VRQRPARLLIATVLATAVACSSPRSDGSNAPRSAGAVRSTARVEETYEYVYRPGHGDEGSTWKRSDGKRWEGAGRHPQWRGCRHTYDPGLSAFLFGPGPKSA
jgi:hypothetical protein